jgi:tetratricopeptide (TPR) repeat protein
MLESGIKRVEAIKERLKTFGTPLTQINFLESLLKSSETFETKRFVTDELCHLYEDEKMFEKAAKCMSSRAGIDVTFREKIESYLKAAEFYARLGKIDDAEEMFTRAARVSNSQQKARILLARKNIYQVCVKDCSAAGKTASCVPFLEKLMKMNLDDIEKHNVRKKLMDSYKRLGKFKEAELLGGM